MLREMYNMYKVQVNLAVQPAVSDNISDTISIPTLPYSSANFEPEVDLSYIGRPIYQA